MFQQVMTVVWIVLGILGLGPMFLIPTIKALGLEYDSEEAREG